MHHPTPIKYRTILSKPCVGWVLVVAKRNLKDLILIARYVPQISGAVAPPLDYTQTIPYLLRNSRSRLWNLPMPQSRVVHGGIPRVQPTKLVAGVGNAVHSTKKLLDLISQIALISRQRLTYFQVSVISVELRSHYQSSVTHSSFNLPQIYPTNTTRRRRTRGRI